MINYTTGMSVCDCALRVAPHWTLPALSLPVPHCCAKSDSEKNIRINEKIKERNRLEKEMEEESLEEIAKQSGGNDENEEIEEETDDKVEEISEEDMWEEIFQTIGILPRDCPCKQYSKALYKRCVVDGKALRGLRPKHAIACTKQIAPL